MAAELCELGRALGFEGCAVREFGERGLGLCDPNLEFELRGLEGCCCLLGSRLGLLGDDYFVRRDDGVHYVDRSRGRGLCCANRQHVKLVLAVRSDDTLDLVGARITAEDLGGSLGHGLGLEHFGFVADVAAPIDVGGERVGDNGRASRVADEYGARCAVDRRLSGGDRVRRGGRDDRRQDDDKLVTPERLEETGLLLDGDRPPTRERHVRDTATDSLRISPVKDAGTPRPQRCLRRRRRSFRKGGAQPRPVGRAAQSTAVFL